MLRTSDNTRSHEKGESNQTDRLSAVLKLYVSISPMDPAWFALLSLSLSLALLSRVRVIR